MEKSTVIVAIWVRDDATRTATLTDGMEEDRVKMHFGWVGWGTGEKVKAPYPSCLWTFQQPLISYVSLPSPLLHSFYQLQLIFESPLKITSPRRPCMAYYPLDFLAICSHAAASRFSRV